jgi:hypothetical protein
VTHHHEALLYRRVKVDVAERVIETCACGATRHTDRGPHRVEWTPWVEHAGVDMVRFYADAELEGMNAGDGR